jgi:hypothetical protein
MYEHRQARPLSRGRFYRRVANHSAAAALVLAGSLLMGIVGYIYFESLGWLDAFLNAAMLLGGMGPVNAPKTPGGKLFAGMYALYAGLVFLIAAGVVFAPIAHRLLHRFHFEESGEK